MTLDAIRGHQKEACSKNEMRRRYDHWICESNTFYKRKHKLEPLNCQRDC